MKTIKSTADHSNRLEQWIQQPVKRLTNVSLFVLLLLPLFMLMSISFAFDNASPDEAIAAKTSPAKSTAFVKTSVKDIR